MSQRTQNLVLLAGMGAAAGALGLFAYYGVAKPDEREAEKKETASKVFVARAPTDTTGDGGAPGPVFTALVVKAKGDTTVLNRLDAGWQITQPLAASADAFGVDAMTSFLQTAKFKDTLEENPTDADLEKYGLKSPRFSVSATAYLPDKDGKGAEDPARRQEFGLSAGIDNTFDGSVYVRRDGDKAIHTMEGGVKWSLEKSTFDLRNKDVLALDEAHLQRIDVKAKANRYVLERDAQRGWRLVTPMQEAADAATVTSMLNAARNQKAVGFPTDDAEARKKAALDVPQVDATFTLDSGATVRLRANKTDKPRALVEQAGNSVFAEVPEGLLTDLDKNPQDLRDKAVLAFVRDDVAKVTFAKADAPPMTVERVPTDGGPEEWRVTAPQVGPAKRWKMSSLLWALSSLKATAFGEAKPKSWAKYGLDRPDKEASLFAADGKLLARIQVGKASGGKTPTVFVRGSRDQVLEVDPSRLNDLPSAVADLLEPPPAVDAGASAL